MLSLRIIDNYKYGIKNDSFKLTIERFDTTGSDGLVQYAEKTLGSHSQFIERDKISFDNNDYFLPTLFTKQPHVTLSSFVKNDKVEVEKNQTNFKTEERAITDPHLVSPSSKFSDDLLKTEISYSE